jgi:tRNA(Ile)-lysidine synthase
MTRPLSGEELAAIGRALLDGGPVLLAVSGGVDSLAMLHVAGRVREAAGQSAPTVHAATVDHGLRTGSAADARHVAAVAARYAIPHRTLPWEGPKPATAVQATARAARYRLLHGAMRQAAVTRLALAHTADDQAETVLMRLARGSGIDGLAAMAPVTEADVGTLVRPLLHVAKARLVATMSAWGETWCEDPSNADDAFERVRLRRAMAALAEAGVTVAGLVRSADRVRAVRTGLAAMTGDLLRGHVALSPLGYARIGPAVWGQIDGVRVPDVLQVQVLATVITVVGGASAPVSLAGLERLGAMIAARVRRGKAGGVATLGGTAIALDGTAVVVTREVGRADPAPVHVRPGETVLFDGRFAVTWAVDAHMPHMPRESLGSGATSLTVRALGAAGRAELDDRGFGVPPAPAGVVELSPAVWAGDRLVTAPAVAAAVGDAAGAITCRVRGAWR